MKLLQWLAMALGAAAGLGAMFVFGMNFNWSGPTAIAPQWATVVQHGFGASNKSASNWLVVRLLDGALVRIETSALVSPYVEGQTLCVQGSTPWIGDNPDLWIVGDAKCRLPQPLR